MKIVIVIIICAVRWRQRLSS